MKNIIKILLAIVIILTIIRVYQEAILLPGPVKPLTKPNFTEPKFLNVTIGVIEKPGKLVVFEQSHQDSRSIFTDFSQFASIFTEAKFEVKATTEEDVVDEIKGADVLVLLAPTKSYSEEEATAIKELVGNGTTLIVLGEPDSARVVNQIALSYGISFNQDLVYDTERYVIVYKYPLITSFNTSTMTKGLTDVALIEGCSLSLSSAQPLAFSSKTTKSSSLIYATNFPLMATASGKEKVFVICDSDLFSNKFLKSFDHEILARNIVNWS